MIWVRECADHLREDVGHVEREIGETNMVTFSFCFGALLAMLSRSLGQFSIGLGSVGGRLASELCIAYLCGVFPMLMGIPSVASLSLVTKADNSSAPALRYLGAYVSISVILAVPVSFVFLF